MNTWSERRLYITTLVTKVSACSVMTTYLHTVCVTEKNIVPRHGQKC
jgi:hypothetical protein